MDLNYIFMAVLAVFVSAGMIYDAGYRHGERGKSK